MKALLTLCLVGLALVTSPAQSAFVNFEPSLVHPIAVTPNGLRLLALDPPNATLQVWSLASPDDPVPLVSIPVGLEPVSLAVRDDDEIWVVESLSDSISVVSISGQRVVATIPMKDVPADVVFAGTPQRAFVSVAGSDEVRVVDPQTHQVVGQVSIPGKEPRALAVNATGSSVYALVFRSGNRTTLVPAGLLPPPFPTRPGLPLAPPQSRVVSLDDPAFAAHPMNLPDIDLVEIDATTLGITNTIKGIGTINFDLAHDPTLDALWVVSTDARNRFAFEPVVRGRFLESRLSRIDLQPSRPPRAFDLHAHFDHFNIPNAPDRATALAEPVSVVVDDVLGRVFIASQGSDRLGVLDRQGNILARIELSTAPLSDRDTPNKRGPRGLARHPTQSRLYVYHRLSHSIAVVDTLALTVVTEKSLGFDPTPAIIRDGRNVLFEARLAGNGSVSCAGCHVDGEHDLLSWDLGDPHGRLTRLPAQPDLPELPRHAAPAWDLHPMKGPMVTQTLRGLATNAPYHWRGDKATLEDFNGAFESLLGGHRIPATEMSQFARYMELIAHGPNPNQTLDRQYDPSAQRGERTFHQTPAIRFPDQTVVQCATCHSQADGANARIFVPSPAAFIGATQPTNVPQLRGLWRRGSTPVVGLPSKVGFGFAHDGMFPSLRAFVDLNVFNLTPTVEKDDLAHFLESFDSGT
ncbi:MAG: hypothetical protein KDB53_02275, partial [Planctomycetes bacterium]|nr:hypothetical protein [Planctomycetota bacterium]